MNGDGVPTRMGWTIADSDVAFLVWDRDAGSAAERLRPVTTPLEDTIVRRTVYVSVYSSLYLGLDIKQDMESSLSERPSALRARASAESPSAEAI